VHKPQTKPPRKFLEEYFNEYKSPSQVDLLICYYKLPIWFIRKHRRKLSIDNVQKLLVFQTLPEYFIESLVFKSIKYKHLVDIVCMNQKLSEVFIRRYRYRLRWSYISKYQKLSEEFLVEFIDKIDLYWLEVNKNVPKDVFERIKLLKGIL
jgi:hypothetical protein